MRDKRWLKSHTRFLDVGLELISEHGVEQVSVDRIVQKAKVSKQTFYNHFSDIEALVQEVWRESVLQVEAKISEINEDITDPAARIARGIAAYSRLAIDDAHRSRFLVRYWFRADRVTLYNPGLEADLSNGLIKERFVFDDVESVLIYLLGGAAALQLRILQATSVNESMRITQDILMLMLITLGLDRGTAQLISAQATEDVVRQ